MTRFVDPINCDNIDFVEAQLAAYLRDRDSVSDAWRLWFDEYLNGDASTAAALQSSPPPRRRSVFNPAFVNGKPDREHLETARLQDRIDQLGAPFACADTWRRNSIRSA
jgi:hypothetical protein